MIEMIKLFFSFSQREGHELYFKLHVYWMQRRFLSGSNELLNLDYVNIFYIFIFIALEIDQGNTIVGIFSNRNVLILDQAYHVSVLVNCVKI
jgi:hypothetical protein